MIKTAIVLPDIHYPLHDQPALNVIEKAIPIVNPDIAILLGDVGELESVSRWKFVRKRTPNLEDWTPKIDYELLEINVLLDDIDSWLAKANVKEKHLCQGNHEVWLDNFVERYPRYHEYQPEEAYRLEERGYQYHPYGSYLKIGELYFYHGGHYMGKHHAKHHLANLQNNVIYAHNHGVTRDSMGGLNGVHSSFCIGSLKQDTNEANKWLKGLVTNWSHAFAIVYFFDDGTFRCEVVDITDGRTVLYGREINGN